MRRNKEIYELLSRVTEKYKTMFENKGDHETTSKIARSYKTVSREAPRYTILINAW